MFGGEWVLTERSWGVTDNCLKVALGFDWAKVERDRYLADNQLNVLKPVC